MNLLYRSLSLYDILLGLDGHIKLVDFVVSKLDFHPDSKTNTFCGSSEFMAPEVSANAGHEQYNFTRSLLTTVQ
jgi:serine/threonine protein kinase